MSNWFYVTLAYTVVWGSLAVYAIALARRVAAAREVARSLREAALQERERIDQDSALCDAPPAP